MVRATEGDMRAVIVRVDREGDWRPGEFATRLKDANCNLAAVCDKKTLDWPLDRRHS